jgi:coenzyme F420-0:L-glutamate ligase/coenzyme F420-1:gamma-L-glutamate ligase
MKLQFLPIEDVPEISAGAALGSILRESAGRCGIRLHASDIVAIAQKVVSKAEGRLVRLDSVLPSPKAIRLAGQLDKDARLVEVILRESRRLVRFRGDVLICETHHGFICANAGVDRSNVDGGAHVTLLPRNPDASARRLAAELGCPVIITDTFGRPWREGLLDAAIGLWGLSSFIDHRGKTDSKGYPLKATVLAAVDALAAAAGLVMGKTENIPAVAIRGFEPHNDGRVTEGAVKDLLRPAERDLFL